jgi:indole-3-glycerol phosphate synthase
METADQQHLHSQVHICEQRLGYLLGCADERRRVALRARCGRKRRPQTPIVDLRARGDVEQLVQAGADACVFVYEAAGGEGAPLEDLYPDVELAGADWAVEVREEDDLADILDRFDPEILVAASPEADDEELEHVLDLLADVPAGKLVVARPRGAISRQQVVALERAGVDAILVDGEFLRLDSDFGAALAELTGR